MRSTLWLLVACACSTPAPSAPATAPVGPTNTATAPPPPSLIDRLVARAGDASVMLVATETGVIARTEADVLTTVVDGAVDAPSYDPENDVLWFRRDSSLWLADLRQAAPAPVEIVADLPDVSVVVVGRGAYGGTVREPMYLSVSWSDEPTLELEVLIDDFASDEQVAAANKAKLVGKTWLAGEANRARDSIPSQRDAPRLADIPDCDEPDECGFAAEFGNTGWRLFVAQYECGDYCYTSCLIADAKGRVTAPELAGTPVWVAPGETENGGACGDFHFDRSETKFARGAELCVPGGGCKGMGGEVLGFLRPGPIVALGL